MEAILIHKDNGRPVLDVDPIDLPRITVYGNPDHTDETNPDLHRFLSIALAIDMPSALSLVWSSDRAPVMIHCGTCNEAVQAWMCVVYEAVDDGEQDNIVCAVCDES